MFKNKDKFLDSTTASETLKKLQKKNKDGLTKISEIIHDFHENGILLAMIFFSLPIAIPLPYPPGFTTIMGIPLIALSIQMLMRSKIVKLPNNINNYEIKNSTLTKISKKIVPFIEYIEKYVRPRMSFAKSVYCEQFVGIMCLIAAISIALPIPMTNAIPALGITVMSMGLLNRDGLVILSGFVITIVGICIAMFFIAGSWYVIKYFFISIFVK